MKFGYVFDASSGEFIGTGEMGVEVGNPRWVDPGPIDSLDAAGFATVKFAAPKPEDWAKLIRAHVHELIGTRIREMLKTEKRSYPGAGDPHNRRPYEMESKHFRARLQRAKNK